MKQKTTPNKCKRVLAGITISALALATVAGAVNFGTNVQAATGDNNAKAEYGEQLKDQSPASLTDATWGWYTGDKSDWTWVDADTNHFGNVGNQTFVAKNAAGTAYDTVTFTVQPRAIKPRVEVGAKSGTQSNQIYASTEKANINTYQRTVSVSSSGNGTVSGSGSYVIGQSTTIKATPYSGYKFVSWNDGNTSASRSVTVKNGTNSYTATFAKDTYTIPSYGGDWKYIDLYTGETRETERLEAPRRAGYNATGFNTSDPSNVRVYWEETDNALLSMESGEVKNMTIKELYDGYEEMYRRGTLYTAATYGERIGAWVVLANGGRTLGGQNVHPINNSGVTVSDDDINKVKNGENLGTKRDHNDQNDTCVFGGSLYSAYYKEGTGYSFDWAEDSNGEYGSSSRNWAYQDYTGNTKSTYVDENTIVTVICR